MRTHVFALVACAAFTLSRGALAGPAEEPQRADAPHEGDSAPRKRVTITVNPVAVAVLRWGGNIEIVPARHHVIIASAYWQTFSLALVKSALPSAYRDWVSDKAPSAAGGEIGYRFYTGTVGADGIFFGPSLVDMPLPYPRLSAHGNSVELQPIHAVGVAVDLGAQTVTPVGLTIGGGVGVEYLFYSLPDDPQRLPITFAPHILPRLLMTAGWSF